MVPLSVGLEAQLLVAVHWAGQPDPAEDFHLAPHRGVERAVRRSVLRIGDKNAPGFVCFVGRRGNAWHPGRRRVFTRSIGETSL